MWEQASIAAMMQKWWSDNGVSATITFDPQREGKDIPHLLSHFEDKLKAISLLPIQDHGYPQAPYISISKEQYESAVSGLSPLNLDGDMHDTEDAGCDNDACQIPSL